MIRRLFHLGVALLSASTVIATTCSLTQKCPKEAPCCSQYGECGIGAYCLGGCDPRMSFSLDACVPAPTCKDKTYKMDSLDKIIDIGQYLGDSSKYDFISSGEPKIYNGNVLLTMAARSSGTVLASTEYVWYGTVKARLKTGRGAGVVTAFILLSDVKDEIDYEFVGADLGIAQTNYYFQGITDYHNSGNITVSNTYSEWHDYEIQWTPDSITWLVDGKAGRTKYRNETWNATSNQWGFPQTPARLQISIWPAGDSKNAKGTIDWAGGLIDWNSDDIKNYGYDFATFGEMSVKCFNANSAPGTNKGVSYTIGSYAATNDTVTDGDKPTVLKSFLGSGLDMNAGASASGTGSNPAATVNTVPGGSSGGGVGTVPGSDGGSNGGGDGSSTNTAPSCTATGFSQSCGSNSNKNDGVRGAERTLGASAFAVVIGFAGLLFL